MVCSLLAWPSREGGGRAEICGVLMEQAATVPPQPAVLPLQPQPQPQPPPVAEAAREAQPKAVTASPRARQAPSRPPHGTPRTHPLMQALQVSGEGLDALGIQEALNDVRGLQPANGEGVPAGSTVGGMPRGQVDGQRGEGQQVRRITLLCIALWCKAAQPQGCIALH
jgi:hypothetical protein